MIFVSNPQAIDIHWSLWNLLNFSFWFTDPACSDICSTARRAAKAHIPREARALCMLCYMMSAVQLGSVAELKEQKPSKNCQVCLRYWCLYIYHISYMWLVYWNMYNISHWSKSTFILHIYTICTMQSTSGYAEAVMPLRSSSWSEGGGYLLMGWRAEVAMLSNTPSTASSENVCFDFFANHVRSHVNLCTPRRTGLRCDCAGCSGSPDYNAKILFNVSNVDILHEYMWKAKFHGWRAQSWTSSPVHLWPTAWHVRILCLVHFWQWKANRRKGNSGGMPWKSANVSPDMVEHDIKNQTHWTLMQLVG